MYRKSWWQGWWMALQWSKLNTRTHIVMCYSATYTGTRKVSDMGKTFEWLQYSSSSFQLCEMYHKLIILLSVYITIGEGITWHHTRVYYHWWAFILLNAFTYIHTYDDIYDEYYSVVGMEGPVMMRDLWKHEDLGVKNTRYDIMCDGSLFHLRRLLICLR